LPRAARSWSGVTGRFEPLAELLHVDRLRAGYGEAVVLAEVSLDLAEGRSLALLGRNGMGK
jgi:branched-chain amino acid transport system ATP-binding protein